MGLIKLFYNQFYRLNIWGTDIRYREDEVEEMPALPDLSSYFTPYSPLGTYRINMDPRFPWITQYDQVKKCYLNFGVWRECLNHHSEDMDEKDPNALICYKYKNLARVSCTHKLWGKLTEAVSRDQFGYIMGLSKRRRGTNPTLLEIDTHHNVRRVVNQNKNGHIYLEGQKYYRYHGRPGFNEELYKERKEFEKKHHLYKAEH